MQKRIKREKREFIYQKENNTASLTKTAPTTGQEILFKEQKVNSIDDEYSTRKEPRILLTTSRNPSSKLIQFTKEIKLVIPGAERINRGGYVLGDLVEAGLKGGCTDVIVLHEHRGYSEVLEYS